LGSVDVPLTCVEQLREVHRILFTGGVGQASTPQA
jgi:hypothetical protein